MPRFKHRYPPFSSVKIRIGKMPETPVFPRVFGHLLAIRYYSHSAEEHFMSFMGTVNTYKTRVFSMYYTLFMVSTRSRLRFGIAFGIGVGINHLGLLLIILPPIMIPVFHFHHFHRSAYSNLRLVVGGRSNHVRGSPLFYIKRLLKSIDSFHKISCTYLA